ncbi:hypothetical protein [Candidatus Electronema sp. JM]
MFVKSKAGDQMPTCLDSGLMVLMWLKLRVQRSPALENSELFSF